MRLCKASPRESKASNEEYLSHTVVIILYIEAQSPHDVDTWTLREYDVTRQPAMPQCCTVASLWMLLTVRAILSETQGVHEEIWRNIDA